MTDIDQEPELSRRTRQRSELVASWMQDGEIPEHHRQQMQDLAEWLETPKAAEVFSGPIEDDDHAEQDRDKRRERRRKRRAERMAEAYREQYGITPEIWISLSVWVIRAILWWLRGRE